jgi:hypothetical protein
MTLAGVHGGGLRLRGLAKSTTLTRTLRAEEAGANVTKKCKGNKSAHTALWHHPGHQPNANIDLTIELMPRLTPLTYLNDEVIKFLLPALKVIKINSHLATG